MKQIVLGRFDIQIQDILGTLGIHSDSIVSVDMEIGRGVEEDIVGNIRPTFKPSETTITIVCKRVDMSYHTTGTTKNPDLRPIG